MKVSVASLAMMLVVFLLVGCSQGDPPTAGQAQENEPPTKASPPEPEGRATNPPKERSRETPPKPTGEEAARGAPASAPTGASFAPPTPAPSEPPPSAAREESPEEVLALQYRLINAGDYDGAYALFAKQSKQLVSPEQYGSYFGANAPYSITDYSFPSVDVQGDAATVEVALTADSASGQESYQRAQQLLREDGAWRVVMRPDQASAFVAGGAPSGAEDLAQYEPEAPPGAEAASRPEATPEAGGTPSPEATSAESPDFATNEEEPTTESTTDPAPRYETTSPVSSTVPSEAPPQYETTAAPPSGGSGANCVGFDYQEDAQEAYDADPSDAAGVDGPSRDASAGVAGVACEELPSKGVEVLGGTTGPEKY